MSRHWSLIGAPSSASPQFAGRTVTEVNPDRLPDPSDLGPLVAMLATALATRSGAE